MTTKTDGGPAFPFGQISETTGQPVNGFYDPGMSLRDYFAAKAIQGLLAMEANPQFGTVTKPYSEHGRDDLMAKCAYALADAMLASRENT